MAEPPVWMNRFIEQVSVTIIGFDLLAPLGCHFTRNEDVGQWEITLFVASTEILGGALDGRCTACPFALELNRLQQCFDKVQSFHWQSHSLGAEDDLGQHVAIEGEVGDQRVWLRIVADPPKRFGPGRVVKSGTRELIEHW